MKFEELSINPGILRNCRKMGYTTPTKIQQKAIPPVLEGRDLLGLAQTGTGKTAAFALPILDRLAKAPVKGKRPVRALVLTPTRELAIQIVDNFHRYGESLPLKTTVIFGGVKQGAQVEQLKRGTDVLIATPGRLLDLVGQGLLDLGQVEIFVLDEADRMLDMGFIHDVKKISALLVNKQQTLLFSATMPKEISGLAASLLKNPVRVEATPVSTPIEKIEQAVYFVEKKDKSALLMELLKDKSVTSALVFTRTKHEADKVVRVLNKGHVKAMAIHGNKSQNARQNALAAFKNHQIRVLVATDIAARGIDIERLSHVVNFNIPNISETYVHRIGRTARAGESGVAISFCQTDERPYLKDIEKLIRYTIPVRKAPKINQESVMTLAELEAGNQSEAKSEAKRPGSSKAVRTQVRNEQKPAASQRSARRRFAGQNKSETAHQ